MTLLSDTVRPLGWGLSLVWRFGFFVGAVFGLTFLIVGIRSLLRIPSVRLGSNEITGFLPHFHTLALKRFRFSVEHVIGVEFGKPFTKFFGLLRIHPATLFYQDIKNGGVVKKKVKIGTESYTVPRDRIEDYLRALPNAGSS